jgi:pimeloyl-ACP methyl ester carboxylesterase
MPSIQVEGLQTAYQSIGRHKPTLLLLHGWGNDWQAWSNLIPVLSEKYRLIIPDLPGFGQSESPKTGWSTPRYVRWLQAFLQELEITELEAVLGHSYGGKLAAFGWLGSNASELPILKHGILAIGPSGIPSRLTATRALLGNILPLIPAFIRRGLFGSLRTYFYKTVLDEQDYISATPFQEQTLHKILREDIRKVARESSVPVHFCWGERDSSVPLWMAYEYRTTSQHSDVFVVPSAGHFPHHSDTALVLNWIAAIL